MARAPKAWDASHAKLEADAAVLNSSAWRRTRTRREITRGNRARGEAMQSLPDRIDIDGVSRPTKTPQADRLRIRMRKGFATTKWFPATRRWWTGQESAGPTAPWIGTQFDDSRLA